LLDLQACNVTYLVGFSASVNFLRIPSCTGVLLVLGALPLPLLWPLLPSPLPPPLLLAGPVLAPLLPAALPEAVAAPALLPDAACGGQGAAMQVIKGKL
jgi:hypothetical protein